MASLSPVLVGLVSVGSIPRIGVAAATLVCAVALQILSNLVNDYYDFKRGADKDGRVGPARALAEGKVSQHQMLKACYIALAVSLVLGLWLVCVGGLPIIAIGLSAILFAWLYTATRFSLSYLGIADLFCFLYYGPVAAAGTAYLQTGSLLTSAIWAGCACGCISVCVLATNNIRDVEDDRLVGKRTIPVRFGVRFALVGVALLLLGAVVCIRVAFHCYGFVILMVLWYVDLLCVKNPKAYNKKLFQIGLLNLWMVICAAVSLIVLKL